MWAYLKQHYFRRQRGKKVCRHCRNGGTLERPLMFSVEDNAYYHDPSCDDAVQSTAERRNMVFNG